MGSNGSRRKTLYLRVTRQGQTRAGEPDTKFLAVPGGLALHNLAEVISEAFDLPFGPPYGFYDERIDETERSDRPTRRHAETMETAAVLDSPGRSVLFVYDARIELVVRLIGVEETPPLK